MDQIFFRWKGFNSVLLALIFIIGLSNASALVSVFPDSSTLDVCPGNNVSINITISGVSGVYGFQFDLNYNSSILDLVSVANGTFLSNNGQNSVFCLQPDLSSAGLIDDFACSIMGESGSTPVSGVLATINFRLKEVSAYPATSIFTLSDVKLSDMDSNALDDSSADGQASITCTCVEGDIVSCNDANGCPGNRTCSDGELGACVTPTSFFCDADCDGDNDCVEEECDRCDCIGSAPVSCTTDDECPGNRSCTNGTLGPCQIIGYYCDADCDGDNDTCSDTPCEDCGCIENWYCETWDACVDGYQSRECYDINDCGTDDRKPTDERTCTVVSSSGGGGGGGGSIPSSLASCDEAWVCDNWDACSPDGFRRRTCADANSCGTSANKPIELEVCFYEGSCDDGIMNGQEEGVDCGGACPNPCVTSESAGLPMISLLVHADPIVAEILDQYPLKVTVENTGEQELLDLEVVASKWSATPSLIRSILPGLSEQSEILLSLPIETDEPSIDIHIVSEGAVLASKSIPITLSIPEYSIKINHDPETQRTYQAVIVDNRGKPARTIEVDFTINKGKETYLIEAGKSYHLDEDTLFNQVDYLYQTLPAGSYEVKSVFYENGQEVAESTSKVTIGGDKKALNVQYFFYALLLVIVGFSGYMFFISQKKNKYD
ncbi:hypothetical protein JXB28_06510 [Candidatus Woesearchaeota archaeon]|nr:hypothetical protein [Candidatus Woesearchaeota archaeon]